MTKSVDALDLLEVAYDIEAEPSQWLVRVAEVCTEALRVKAGAFAYQYAIDATGCLSVERSGCIGMEDALVKAGASTMASFSPEYVRETFACTPCALSARVGSRETRAFTRKRFDEIFGWLGWRDLLVINGLDPTGRGVYLGVPMLDEPRLSAAEKNSWSRVAAHLAAANRLRSRLRKRSLDGADAILTPAGKVEHAIDDAAAKSARELLSEGALAIRRARGALRKGSELAVAEWQGLIAARWTLIDHFESDGKRYLLAQRNEPVTSGLSALSERERQAVGFASLGHSNKLIAYEMGITPSTVGVLLYRAARRLGAKTRSQLIAAYRQAQTS